MTTIDIHKWKGNEFSTEFTDFVVTGMLEAKATGSVQTGRMVNSIKLKKIRDGFSVYSDRADFPPTSRGKARYYTYVYHEKGYPTIGAFPFIHQAFDTIGDSDNLVNSNRGVYGAYKAHRPSGRRGAGVSTISSSDLSAVTSYLGKQGRKNKVRIPRVLQKHD